MTWQPEHLSLPGLLEGRFELIEQGRIRLGIVKRLPWRIECRDALFRDQDSDRGCRSIELGGDPASESLILFGS